MFELQRYYSWIIDRFHISTQVVQKAQNGFDLDFREMEERLKALNFRQVFLHRSAASFEAARERRLKISGNPSQYNDLNLFIAEQEQFRHYIHQSILPTLHVDISDDDMTGAVQKIVDWLVATNGLYMTD